MVDSSSHGARTNAITPLHAYVCPDCEGHLVTEAASLRCPRCLCAYPVLNSIPDFVVDDLRRSTHPVVRMERLINFLAPLYETKIWYPLILRSLGAKRVGLPTLRATVAEMMADVRGNILDVACGPGTFGRVLANPAGNVYGIDIARNMLATGVRYAAREGTAQMYFARAQVERLPFGDEFFDGALCCGSLHLFADCSHALAQVSRTVKPGAPLLVITTVVPDAGLLRWRPIRSFLKDRGLHVFQPHEIESLLRGVAFVLDDRKTYGALFICRAHKITEQTEAFLLGRAHA